VAASLIEEVTMRVQDPPVPVWHNPDKDRDEPNPGNPEYQRALTRATRDRGMAAIDAMVMFGIDLAEPVPPADTWLPKLQFLERRGTLDLSGYQLDNALDLEFLYKRYIAVSSMDLTMLSRSAGISPVEVERATRTFPGPETRDTDNGGQPAGETG
jgi:hypothetical protein